jgi:hypothetical protein
VTFEKKTQMPWIYYYYFQFSEVEKLENFFPKSDKFSWYYTAKTHLSRNFPKFLPQKKKQCQGLFRVKSLCVSLHLLTLLKEKESLHHVRFRIQFLVWTWNQFVGGVKQLPCMPSSTFWCQIIILFWRFHFKK